MNNELKQQLRGEDIPASEITTESAYAAYSTLKRRGVLHAAGLAAAGLALTGLSLDSHAKNRPLTIRNVKKNALFVTSEELTTWDDATSYNNFYEFGLGKSDPAANSQDFEPFPWSVEIAGECEVKGKFSLADLLKGHQPEERVYRHRCVEAWSMVLPWVGIPLGNILRRYKPTSKAKYVAFTTLNDPKQMPNQRGRDLDWPYREGLRIDEAMNPLAMIATGLYGRTLPNQKGAPIRLVTPWKYGFKGIKSIVKIEFTEAMPFTSWSDAASDEYGFFANVNPEVDHPRWSQASERRIAGTGVGFLKTKRIDTLKFNGYGNFVADLYRDMDLARYY